MALTDNCFNSMQDLLPPLFLDGDLLIATLSRVESVVIKEQSPSFRVLLAQTKVRGGKATKTKGR